MTFILGTCFLIQSTWSMESPIISVVDIPRLACCYQRVSQLHLDILFSNKSPPFDVAALLT